MAERRVTIAGQTVAAIGPIPWALTLGTTPFTTVVQVHESEASRILGSQGKTVSITVHGDGGWSAENVYVVGRAPSTAPFYVGIVLADRRWLWQRKHILRRYNVPRRSGNRQFLGGGLVEVAQITDTYTFADWSLKGGQRRWTAREVLEDVLDQIEGKNAYTIRGTFRDVPIENLELDEAAPGAVNRALASLPGASLFVDRKGKIKVYDAANLAEARKVLKDATPLLLHSAHPCEVKQAAIRPMWIDVLLTREVELRFDSVEEGEGRPRYAQADDDGTMDLANVAPSPDLVVDIDGKPVWRGTYYDIPGLVESWAADPLGSVAEPITLEAVRKNWFFGLWNTWAENGRREPSADWMARLSTLRRHYRQTWRLPRAWMRRIRSIRAHRVAILDAVTQSRAPALVESDYCVEAGEKPRWMLAQGQIGPDEFCLFQNVRGYPTDGLIATGKQAPATLAILDEDLGVVRLDYVLDPTRRADAIHPSLVLGPDGTVGGPSHDFRYSGLKKFPPTSDTEITGVNAAIRLSEGHRVLVVLTAVPGAPNNERQLHRIRIFPKDVAGMIPEASKDCVGPSWTLRISPAFYTAKFCWDDRWRELYPQIFGFGSADPAKAGIDSEAITGEIWQNPNECHSIAKAAAAALWTKMADHIQGDASVHGNPALEPAGNVSAVAHSLAPDGLAQTVVSFAPELMAGDLWSYLPSGVRSIILGLVQFRNP